MNDVRVLAFDIFGTVLDWRSSLIAEGKRLGCDLDPQPDWEAFAVAWSKGYTSEVAKVEDWVRLEDLLRMAFYDIAPEFGLYGMPADNRTTLAGAWSRLDPWPDAMPGLTKLSEKGFKLAVLSNANRSMQREILAHTRLPFRWLLSAEDAGCYKPCPSIYTKALENLNAAASQVMMVAAHTFDLNAAHALGFRTALIERPSEPGSGRSGLNHEADIIVPDIEALADAIIRND